MLSQGQKCQSETQERTQRMPLMQTLLGVKPLLLISNGSLYYRKGKHTSHGGAITCIRCNLILFLQQYKVLSSFQVTEKSL